MHPQYLSYNLYAYDAPSSPQAPANSLRPAHELAAAQGSLLTVKGRGALLYAQQRVLL